MTFSESKLSGREITLIFAAGLAASLLAVAATGFRSLQFGDSRAYVEAAARLLHEGRYPDRTDLYLFRPPGYPVFLAAVTLGHPAAAAAAKVANAILHGASAVVVASLALRLFGRRRAALAGGLAAAVDPSLLILTTQVQSEPLFVFFLVCAAFLLLGAGDRPSSGLAAASGGMLALASLTRPSALALAPLLGAPLFDRRFPRRIRISLAASAFAGFGLFLGPWTLRNAIRYRAFLPVNDGAGLVFYQGNSDWAVRYYGVGDREGLDRWIADYSSSLASWPDRIPGLRSANPARRSAALAAAARSWIGSHPRAEARLLADKLGDWLRPWPDPLFHPRPAVAAFGALETALFAAAALGLFRCRRRGAAGFAIGVLALSTAAHVVLLAAWRYRTPYWEPVLILYGIASFFAAPKAARHSP